MDKFNANRALYQLKMAHPSIARRHESELLALLGRVSNEVIKSYLATKPKSTLIYLGTLSDGKRGVSLRLDSFGRVNTDWVEIPRLMKRYETDNNLWAVLDKQKAKAAVATV